MTISSPCWENCCASYSTSPRNFPKGGNNYFQIQTLTRLLKYFRRKARLKASEDKLIHLDLRKRDCCPCLHTSNWWSPNKYGVHLIRTKFQLFLFIWNYYQNYTDYWANSRNNSAEKTYPKKSYKAPPFSNSINREPSYHKDRKHLKILHVYQYPKNIIFIVTVNKNTIN